MTGVQTCALPISGFYPIFEAEYGKVTSVYKIKQKQPIINFLKMQRRFAHLTGKKADPKVLERLQAVCDENIKVYDLLGDSIPETVPTAIQAFERQEM